MKRIRILILTFITFPGYSISQNVSTQIKLNQIGFYPNASKVAAITGSVSANNFYITSTNLRDTVFSGTLSSERKSAYSTTITKIADFSSLQKEGSFVILIPGVGHSYVFEINDHVHH